MEQEMGTLVIKRIHTPTKAIAKDETGLFYCYKTHCHLVTKIENEFIDNKNGSLSIAGGLSKSIFGLIVSVYLPDQKWNNAYRNFNSFPRYKYFVSENQGETWDEIFQKLDSYSDEVLPSSIGDKYYKDFQFSVFMDNPCIYLETEMKCYSYNNGWHKGPSKETWSENATEISWVTFEINYPNLFSEFLLFIEKENRKADETPTRS